MPRLIMFCGALCAAVFVGACATQTTYVKPGPVARVECTHLQILLGEFKGPGSGVQEVVYQAAQLHAKQTFEANNQQLCGLSQSQRIDPGSTHVLRVRSKGGSFNYSSQTTTLKVDLELVDIKSNEVLWTGKSLLGFGNQFNDRTRLAMMQSLLQPAFKMMSEAGLVALSPA